MDDTDMTAAEFRAARERGTPLQVVKSREAFDADSRRGGATFEVYEDRTGKFRFRLRASTGQVVATSEAYETKAAARRGATDCMASPAYTARVERLRADTTPPVPTRDRTGHPCGKARPSWCTRSPERTVVRGVESNVARDRLIMLLMCCTSVPVVVHGVGSHHGGPAVGRATVGVTPL